MADTWQPTPQEEPSLTPPRVPPRTAVGVAELPPSSPFAPHAILWFSASGLSHSYVRTVAFAAVTVQFWIGLCAAGVFARHVDPAFGDRWLITFTILVVLGAAPPLLFLLLRIRRLVEAGYDRRQLVRWLCRDSAWKMPSTLAVELPLRYRVGWVMLWPLVYQVVLATQMLQTLQLNREGVIGLSVLVVVCDLVALFVGLAPAVVTWRARERQWLFWDSTTTARVLFAIAGVRRKHRTDRRVVSTA